MAKKHYSKGISIFMLAIVYAVALGWGYIVFGFAVPAMPELWALLVADVVATVIVWGVWVMYASLFGLDWLVLAPVAMTALFLFISIPMMERRQLENKPGYADYIKRTRIFI